MPIYVLKVDQDNSDERLDVYLTENLSDVPSRSFIKKLIDQKAVTVNSRHVKAHVHVVAGDEISVNMEFKKAEDLKPESLDLDIFYEDEDLIVVNKKVGMIEINYPLELEKTPGVFNIISSELAQNNISIIDAVISSNEHIILIHEDDLIKGFTLIYELSK